MKAKYILPVVAVAAALVGIFLFTASSRPDKGVYIESEQVIRGTADPDRTATIIMKHYLTTDAIRTDVGDRVTIIRFKEKVLDTLDPVAKTYTTTAIDDIGNAKELADSPKYKAMIKSMSEGAQVKPTDETRQIEGYNCRKYAVTILDAESEYWVSKEVQGIDKMKEVGERSAELFASNPMIKHSNLPSMLKDLGGYPVQTITKRKRSTVTSTLKKIEIKRLDNALFVIPKDYQQVKAEG